VAHSLSPALHNAAFNALGLDFVYTAFRVEHLANAINGMRALENFRGLSVTIPHKIEIIGYMDQISELDQSIGSINTVINANGILTGVGTDGPGAMKALLAAGVVLDGARILLLGAGGAARAIAFTLAMKAAPAELVLMDINAATVDGLTADLRNGTKAKITAIPLDEAALAAAVGTADVIINCTPIGMHPREDASVVPAGLLRPGQSVFDIVYNPLETRLLREARGAGCRVVSGVEMFINQAVLQFELFTGQSAPEDVMRQVVMERLNG
jgi:shikimate dehydrogenase